MERLQISGIWLETQYLSLRTESWAFPTQLRPVCLLQGQARKETTSSQHQTVMNKHFCCVSTSISLKAPNWGNKNTMCAVIPVWMLELRSKSGELWKLSLSRKDMWLSGWDGGEKTDFSAFLRQWMKGKRNSYEANSEQLLALNQTKEPLKQQEALPPVHSCRSSPCCFHSLTGALCSLTHHCAHMHMGGHTPAGRG